ncbi:hypothetical protein K474DRAFT_47076 [Panus rudis PR-1116 ss-1]|nr:hypothetical protein K474DRAFT_47076 [Panus rudis PR-1116 ss-1]
MATAAPLKPSLCDLCHQRPKSVGHPFCSKTCAAQAATVLCAHCHQKPKFGNFEYCGKHCAAQAQNSKPQNQVPTAPQAPQLRVQVPNVATGSTKVPSQQKQTRFATTQAPPAVPQQPASQSQSQSKANWVKNAAAQIPGILTNSNAGSSTKQSTQAQPLPTGQLPKCAIPGCDEPVHVDRNGLQTSEYCSQRHREEAVDAGLVSPCVMCLTMPQSKNDYFCGRVCREEANHKSVQ